MGGPVSAGRLRRLCSRAGRSTCSCSSLLLAAAYWLWRHARGAVDGGMGDLLLPRRDLVSAERSLGLLIEPSVQHWAVGAGWPAEVARWGYANLHFKGSCLMLAVLYFGYRGSFGFVRNMVFAAMAISVLGYALFPTAPPRFLPELGLDPSSAVTGNNPLLSNPRRRALQPVRGGALDARRALGDLRPGRWRCWSARGRSRRCSSPIRC